MSLSRDDVMQTCALHILHIKHEVQKLVTEAYDVSRQDVVSDKFFLLIMYWYHALLFSYHVKFLQNKYGYDTERLQAQLVEIRSSVKAEVLRYSSQGILQGTNKTSWARLWMRLDSGATNDLTRNNLTRDIYERMITCLNQWWYDQFFKFYGSAPYNADAFNPSYLSERS